MNREEFRQTVIKKVKARLGKEAVQQSIIDTIYFEGYCRGNKKSR